MFSRRRDSGYPTSANRASSFHLWWHPSTPADTIEVGLEVLDVPAVEDLYFWAVQISFLSGGQPMGGAHLGLQWNRRHLGSTAVNWGGYSTKGSLLAGTPSSLPSTPGDPHTRDFPWTTGTVYRLRVQPGATEGWWRGSVLDESTGEVTTIRELHGGGDLLGAPVVWSEVFAKCDDPSVKVRWSRPESVVGSSRMTPEAYRVSFQPVERGGCSNTDVWLDGSGVVQATSTPRRVPDGSLIPIG